VAARFGAAAAAVGRMQRANSSASRERGGTTTRYVQLNVFASLQKD
jgi:hypothetical protein